jgi:hypothetical protein
MMQGDLLDGAAPTSMLEQRLFGSVFEFPGGEEDEEGYGESPPAMADELDGDFVAEEATGRRSLAKEATLAAPGAPPRPAEVAPPPMLSTRTGSVSSKADLDDKREARVEDKTRAAATTPAKPVEMKPPAAQDDGSVTGKAKGKPSLPPMRAMQARIAEPEPAAALTARHRSPRLLWLAVLLLGLIAALIWWLLF